MLLVPASVGAFITGAVVGYLIGIHPTIGAVAALVIWVIMVNRAVVYFHSEITKEIQKLEVNSVSASKTGPSPANHTDGDPPITN